MKPYDDDEWNDESFDDSAGDYYPDDQFDEENETITCRACGASMYEDSPQCPACGEYPSREQHPPQKATWIVLTGVLCLLVVLTWFLL